MKVGYNTGPGGLLFGGGVLGESDQAQVFHKDPKRDWVFSLRTSSLNTLSPAEPLPEIFVVSGVDLGGARTSVMCITSSIHDLSRG